ncbi:MAG: Biopolymer transport protein ExbD [bacterium ADurb.Bin431]|nr:MAG: Biopolymer transport protein ExbD [bacterium ADurb.Bin431]HNY91672.1 biopolymer transporter ExbD [bacterium]HOH09000.1 biopolymer transporter ExbD [bacterium]HOY44060.1 biopolymer transporter ExbD [bacterium]HPG84000.1 biopolymer transporter ExbD [bacterium]
MIFKTTRKRIISYAAISLTDIILLLLIYFLLSSSFIVQPGIKVTLPRAAAGEVDKADKIYLTVTKSEQLFLNGELVSKDVLGARLTALLRIAADKTVIIRADKDLTLEATVQVIDIAKLAGAEKFLIATEPGE